MNLGYNILTKKFYASGRPTSYVYDSMIMKEIVATFIPEHSESEHRLITTPRKVPFFALEELDKVMHVK